MKWKKIGTAFLALFTVAIFVILAWSFLQTKIKREREEIAVETLTEIYQAEMKFKSSHGSFGTLSELSDAGLIHQSIGSRATSIYIYNLENSSASFCAFATRGPVGKAYRDFNVDQTGVVRFVEATQVSKIPCGSGIPVIESR